MRQELDSKTEPPRRMFAGWLAAAVAALVCAGSIGWLWVDRPAIRVSCSPVRIPARLALEDFQRPLDCVLIQQVEKFERTGASRWIDGKVLKPYIDDVKTGFANVDGVEIRQGQFPDCPELHRIVCECARILKLERKPRVYIVGGSDLNAYTTNFADPIIVLSSAILRRFKSEAELRFLIGHEMGHIRARHVKMLTVLRCLAAALCLGGAVPDEVALLPLLPVFMWSREAEMTADNAGLICAQDRAAAETALVRQLLNLSEQDIGKINVEQFLGQREAEEHSRFSEIVLCVRQVISSHPFTPDRVRQIREYAASPRYRHIWH